MRSRRAYAPSGRSPKLMWMQASDVAAIEQAIYDESFRTVAEQARVLEGLRTRAGTLVAVANVATAFLGGLALADQMPVNGGGADLAAVEWLAIAFFCAAFAISLGILMPSRNWIFWHHPHALLTVYVDPGPPTTLSEFRRSIAFYNGEHYDANGRRLRVLALLLWVASLFLAAEVVLWLWSLAT